MKIKKMKAKQYVHSILAVLAAVVVFLAFPSVGGAYSLILPEVLPPPPYLGGPELPYEITADHYSGPACIQMALNSCPNVAARQYHSSQDFLYDRILAHDTELGLWYSNPEGMRATLMDPILAPCGNWVDYSDTDRDTVMGAMLYWMAHTKYLTPVSVSDGEEWVNVCGFQSNVKPSTTTYTVDLYNVFWYDPKPGAALPFSITSATVWESQPEYWGVPHDKPASSWHNKYIALIEPPPIKINVNIKKWVFQGPILPVYKIEKAFYNWLKNFRHENLARGPFKTLAKPQTESKEMGKPFLVDTGKYKYYIVPFKNRRMVTIFNAYDGSFEEYRHFKQPLEYELDSRNISKKASKALKAYKVKNMKILTTAFKYRRQQAHSGRFTPTWQVEANVTDAKGKEHRLTMVLNTAGEVFKGLEALPVPKEKPCDGVKTVKKSPLLSLHFGTAVPTGNLADYYKAGFNVVGDLEFPLKDCFSLRALLGYNRFKSKFDNLDDTSIVNINLNLRYTTTGRPLTFFAEAGPGYYLLKDSDNRMGLNAGCGLIFKINRRIRFELAAHHNTIFTSEKNTYFVHLAGGLLIRLR